MEGGDAPAFDLGNVDRHDFGSYQIERFLSGHPDINRRKGQAMRIYGSGLL